MAEKKYYWLKLTEQFFKDKAIKKLRKIAGGDTYTVIYLKMLLKAITQGNKLYFEGVESDFAEELALDLDEDEENVSVTIAYLKSKGLLRLVNEDEMLLTQCDEMVGSETDAARRKRLQRERERIRELKNGSQAALPIPEAAQPDLQAKEEKEQKEKAKQKKETQQQLYQRLVESGDYSLTEPVIGKLSVWFRYKTERKESYKEQGMKSLLKQVEKNCQKYGEEAVLDLIERCMASNWVGIIWKILEEEQKNRGSISSRVSEVDNW